MRLGSACPSSSVSCSHTDVARDSTQTSIIIASIDIFDFSDGEPAKDVQTILRVLRVGHTLFQRVGSHAVKISNAWALRILVNAHNIERTGLTRTRTEAEALMTMSGLSLAIAADDMLSVRAWLYATLCLHSSISSYLPVL